MADQNGPAVASGSGSSNKDTSKEQKPNLRKRTKTGCMTCRKRRIKCDEAKPVCNHCIKSKRPCEGYTTRVIFKEPFAFQGIGYGHEQYQFTHEEALLHAQFSNGQTRGISQAALPIIAPRPPHFELAGVQPLPYDVLTQSRSNSVGNAGFGSTDMAFLDQHGQLPAGPGQQHFGGHVPDNMFGLEELMENRLNGHAQPFQAEAQHFGPDSFPHSRPVPTQQPLRRSSAFEQPRRGSLNPSLPTSRGNATEEVVDEESSEEEASNDEYDDHYTPRKTRLGDIDALFGSTLQTYQGTDGGHLMYLYGLPGAGVLTNYEPLSSSSPLNDPHIAMVFRYFLEVTGPAISPYERLSDVTPNGLQGWHNARPRPLIWTYKFPVLSFHHPALLQAILALGSLQMARLDNSPATASIKHYGYSIRRIAKNYNSPSKRNHPSTLAATLLLGFYEIWNSDHASFTKHLWGARSILMDIPLKRMTGTLFAHQQDRNDWLRAQIATHQQYGIASGDDELPSQEPDLNLFSSFSGQSYDFDDDTWIFTQRDIEKYENIRDLFWWYCKMDCYQSYLGGTPLLMEYTAWTHCLPRAPIGRLDCAYGTFDHLCLIMGRLADFVSKDLTRKRKVRERDNTSSIPSPNMFPGMFPGKVSFVPPPGFSAPPQPFAESVGEGEDYDFETKGQLALAEWTAIKQALHHFRSCLGPDFEPLGPEVRPAVKSPFGSAQIYQSYSVAGIWLNYYMAMLILYRGHPSMPPFAMVAARKQATKTAPYATQLGRITAGLSMGCANAASISTGVAAALIEATFPLFVAGVQVNDSKQRQWIITQLNQISRLTGWGTAAQIAHGCEGAWLKSYEMGVGPEYIPVVVEDDTPNGVFGLQSQHAASPPNEHGGPQSAKRGGRRIDKVLQEQSGGDRNKRLVLKAPERAHMALGIVGVEQDMERLDLRGGL